MKNKSFSGVRVSRFWQPTGSQIQLDNSGFFVAPSAREQTVDSTIGNDPVLLSQLAHVPCLILLGEPGIGKTTAVEESLVADAYKEGELLHVNLNGFKNEGTVLDRIFKNENFLKWQAGQCDLHLWLDSLDECLFHIETIGLRLGQDLQKCFTKENSSRLWLRIACRPAVWSSSFEKHLRDAFGENQIKILHLCPLQRKDVEVLSEAQNVQPDIFLEAIDQRSANSLAARPITLEFLLASFENGKLADSRVELFRQGCLHLCTEPNDYRQEIRLLGKLEPEKRLKLAARIAALLVFSGRPFIWRGQELYAPSISISVSDVLACNNDTPSLNNFSFQDIDEVLDTPLFNTSDVEGTLLYTFAHRTYAEFLAAFYLDDQKTSEVSVVNLLSHSEPIDSSKALVPQLDETAIWLAFYDLNNRRLGRSNGSFDYIIKSRPAILLGPDLLLASDREKCLLARAVLEEIQAGRLTDNWDRNAYRYLDASGLADELEPFIVDSNIDIIARRTAIDIAEKCPHAFILKDILLKLALNESDEINARIQAAYAVKVIGQTTDDAELLLGLSPLAAESVCGDRDDELKGISLSALWPQFLGSEEFFAVLTPPKGEVLGAYRGFIFHAHERLEPKDLVFALQWCAAQTENLRGDGLPWEFRQFIGEIIEMACKHSDVLLVPEWLARALAVRIREHDIDELWPASRASVNLNQPLEPPISGGRREVITHLVRSLSSSEDHNLLTVLLHFPTYQSPWLLPEDLEWLLSQLTLAENKGEEEAWSILIKNFVDRDLLNLTSQLANNLFTAQVNSAVLRNGISGWFEPLEIVSERAIQLRESFGFWERHAQEQIERNERRKLAQQERLKFQQSEIERLLSDQNVKIEELWPACSELTFNDGDRYGYNIDLNSTEFWKNSSDVTRELLLETADSFLRDFEPTEQILKTWAGGSFGKYALSAHRALLLLHRETPQKLETLPEPKVELWVQSLFWFPFTTSELWKEDNDALFAALNQRVPDAITKAVLARIEQSNRKDEAHFDLQKLRFPWDKSLEEALLEKIGDASLRPHLLYSLLKELLQREALPIVAKWLIEPSCALAFTKGPAQWKAEESLSYFLENSCDELRAKFVALALLEYAPDGGWGVVWPTVKSNLEWGKDVMLEFAPQDRQPGTSFFLRWLPEEDLADWFIWLRREFPQEEDPGTGRFHTISPREMLGYFRSQLPKLIQGRGTLNAVRALERIVRDEAENIKSSSEHWVKYLLPEARLLALASTWNPPKPREIAALLRSEDKRLVSNGEELLDVIVEALWRINQKLQDKTPAAPDLWDTLPRRPKDENALSNWLKRHLEDEIRGKGIIVNREVEISRGEGKGASKGKGERTDIQVDAFMKTASRDDLTTITAIIEVKGAWHADLKNAMETQLRDRYLLHGSCNHGLYIVAWYACPQWDTLDSRNNNPKMTLIEARQHYSAQAAQLSRGGASLRAFVLDAKLS